MRLACIALIIGGVGGVGGVVAQTPYEIGPPASWVKVREPVLSVPHLATEGTETLLADRQDAVRASGVEQYWHVAYRVLDEGAVQQNSQLEIVFDSSYQRLVLHAVRLRRGERVIDQLKPGRVRVAQRETELEEQIYDASLSVVILLEDVRRGDVIEYSFTRRGTNPVFGSHYTAQPLMQTDVPVMQRHFRLVWPAGRPLFIHPRQTTLQPTITTAGATTEYEWSARDVPAQIADPDLPSWYDAYAAVQLSDFATWSAVAAWGDSLFPDAEIPGSLRPAIEHIRTSSESPEQRTLAALRYVQDEVRYLGIEIGVNSHRPYLPATVMRRRYGDCKDKTLLLITMLRALGVTARPALVSTSYHEHVASFHPTTTVFDHAIVQVELGGRNYWIDPTALYQRGGLRDVAAWFGSALVLGGGGDSLVPMEGMGGTEPTTDVAVTFYIGGRHDPATMHVVTEYHGAAANGTRAWLAARSPKERQQQYTNFYSELYPSIRTDETPSVDDNETDNVIRTVERYTIPDFWAGGTSEHPTGKFEPLDLAVAVPRATAANRKMPLAVRHHTHIRYVINAEMPNGWSIRPREEHITTPAARFSRRLSVAGTVFKLEWEYETLADHVMPASAAEHIKQMARANDLLVFTITPPREQAEVDDETRLNWSVLLAALLAAALAVMGAVRVSRAQVAVAGDASVPGLLPPAIPRNEPAGLGGWLVLLGFGVTISPIRVLFTLSKTLPSYGASTWAALTTPGMSNYHPLWAPLLMFELVGNILLLVFTALMVWLFYRKKRQFPRTFIWVIGGSIVFSVVDMLLTSFVPVSDPTATEWSRAFGRMFVAAIWIGYMLRSRRVRNTFVN
ncbi:MAG TPA: DUF3857 domain-containing protein [Gemmatimonadales bacterium]|jgi:hypothetical protein